MHVATHAMNTRHRPAASGRAPDQSQGPIAMSKKNAYIEKMKLQLDELNAKMNKVDAMAKDAKEEARDKYQQEMTLLRNQSKIAVAKLDELKSASEETWEAMSAEMEKVRDAFIHSFHYFKSQL
jgi:hypothetical protein